MWKVRRWWARQRALAGPGATVPRWVWQTAAAAVICAALVAAERAPYTWVRALPGGALAVLDRDDTQAWLGAAKSVPALGRALGWAPAVKTDPVSGTPAPAGALPTGLGRLRWPLAGAVVSGFGFRGGGSDPEYHTGLDIAAPEGSEVRAIADGRVSSVGRAASGSGYEVVVQHRSGWSSAYAHLAAADVTSGQDVRGGDVLGRLGAGGDDGHQPAAVLHFELRQGGRALDPAPYLGLTTGSGT